jgi:hypothetical protein
MSNPLFNMMGGNNMQNPMLQQLMQFRNSFKGDPRAQVQQLLNSGKVSQSQYDQAVQMANQIQKMMGKL